MLLSRLTLVLFLATPLGVSAAAKRIVSMNLCADELVVLLADPNHIVSVSYNGKNPRKTVYASRAARYITNHGRVEEIKRLNPDLVVASQYSSRYTKRMLRRVGLRVVEVPYIQSIGDLKSAIRSLANSLGREQAGAQLIQQLERDFKSADIPEKGKSPTVLIYHIGGWIKKPPSLAHDLVTLAGLYNVSQDYDFQSWGQLSLEQLLISNPDYLIILSNHIKPSSLSHSRLRHPAFTYYKKQGRIIWIADKWLSCGSPAIVHALNKIHQVVRKGGRR
jgi:iron complex transport system substrate-binding protein